MRGEARARAIAVRLAARMREAAPELRIETEDGRVTVTGRRIRDRLGWIGGLLK